MGGILEEARSFIEMSYKEMGKEEAANLRIKQVQLEIQQTGSYVHTADELEFGAKVAWRNSNRCIGRLFWDSLRVRDKRHLLNEEEIAEALFEHIDEATNGGNIRPVITVFKQDGPKERIEIKNHQLIRYAGYETEEGVMGDPSSLSFTKECQSLGWKGPGGPFDILPLVIQTAGNVPRPISIPEHLIKQVPIVHPEFSWFAELGIRWYAVPIISDMKLEIGGIVYSAAPFNGWYMGTEIGARNLADAGRYNLLPVIAERMGINMERDATLWKDRALVELNAAVLHSYKQAGVSMVDHHTAAKQFKLFEEKEQAAGRKVTGDWTWLIPPVSPATTHIFHKGYRNEVCKPNFFYKKKNNVQ